MRPLGGQGPRPDDDPVQEPDLALAQERLGADDRLRIERKMLDAAVNSNQIDASWNEAARRSLNELREKIRRQRIQSDGAAQTQRHATDDAIRVGRASQAPVTVEPIKRPDVSRGLWEVMAELDVMVTASDSLRRSALSREAGSEVLALTSRIDLAAERVLELVGTILDAG